MATKILSEKVVLEHFRKQYESGNGLALLECRKYCRERQLTAPEWVETAYAKAEDRYLTQQGLDLGTAFFGRGRQSNPRQAAVVQRRHEAIFATWRAVQMAGFPPRPSEGNDSIRQAVNTFPQQLFGWQRKDTAKIIREQRRLEQREPDRLQAPVQIILPAGQAVPALPEPVVTSTDNAILVSGALHAWRLWSNG